MKKILIIVATLCGLAAAQLDLASFYTRTVKAGQPWGAVENHLNSAEIAITVQNGVVTTDITFAYTPDSAATYEYLYDPVSWEYTKTAVRKFWADSLETSAWFNLGMNAAVADMWLWVGADKVPAYMQERSLASAQYNEIVGARRDPAILETWGGGSYSLRIFPQETGKLRKLQLRVVQGMEKTADGFSITLPVSHSASSMYYSPRGTDELQPAKSIDALLLTAVALDGQTYNLAWEGIGNFTVGATPLAELRSNVKVLGPGTLRPAAGSQDVWAGSADGKKYFGLRSTLVYDELQKSPEPAQRVFILDVPAGDAAMVLRAKKLALLAIRKYVAEGQTFNLGLVNQAGDLVWLFEGATSPLDAGSLLAAYQKIAAWEGSLARHSLSTLEDFARQLAQKCAPGTFCPYVPVTGDSAAIIFLSGQAYNEYPVPYPVYTEVQSTDQARWENWNTGYQAFYEEQNARAQALAGLLRQEQQMLFGFFQDYRSLPTVAYETGGYQLGGLYGSYYWYAPVAYDAAGSPVALDQWYLPPLFGKGRPNDNGPRNLAVTTTHPGIADLAVLTDMNSYWWGGCRGCMIDGPMMAMKTNATASAIAYYPYWQMDSVTLRIAGTYVDGGAAAFHITGTWGGLQFTRQETATLPALAGGSPLAAGLWALQTSEALRNADYYGSVDSVAALGMEYHIVNSQTSMLALEPGMQLWSELPNSDQQSGGERAGVATSDMKALAPSASGEGGGLNVDKASLEAIFSEVSGVLPPPAAKRNISLSIARKGGALEFRLAGVQPERVQVLDLAGKVVADLATVRTGNGVSAFWQPAPGHRGIFVLSARTGGQVLAQKFAVTE